MDPRDPAVPGLLRDGRIEVTGRIVSASNATLFCTVTLDGVSGECVYKPVRGERPLWDFPDGTLAGREYASYLVAEAFVLDGQHPVVPPTVLREGPFGSGMVSCGSTPMTSATWSMYCRRARCPATGCPCCGRVTGRATRPGSPTPTSPSCGGWPPSMS